MRRPVVAQEFSRIRIDAQDDPGIVRKSRFLDFALRRPARRAVRNIRAHLLDINHAAGKAENCTAVDPDLCGAQYGGNDIAKLHAPENISKRRVDVQSLDLPIRTQRAIIGAVRRYGLRRAP